MAAAIPLGTIFADVELRTGTLAGSEEQAVSALTAIDAALAATATNSETTSAEIVAATKLIADAMGRMADVAEQSEARLAAAAANNAVERQARAAEKALQDEQEQLRKTEAAAAEFGGQLATIFAGGLSALAAGSAAVVKLDADFEQSMQRIQANTTMTDADVQAMKQSVIEMGKESGASFDDIANGYMHVSNFGYKAAESTNIVREAMKSAVATGGSVSSTAEVLAKALHEFNINAGDAGKAMNVFHLAAALGNMTLEQFDAAAGPALGVAANLGVSFTEASAAISTLTKHGYDAAEAATQVKDVFAHVVTNSNGAREEIERLSKATGIDLVRDFSAAGLQSRGLYGLFVDLAKATKGHADEVYKLVPAMRGGQGAMALAGTGAKDYKDILLQLNDAIAGKIDPSTSGYEKSLGTLNNEVARLTNEIKADFIPVGEKLTPLFENAIPVVRELGSGLSSLMGAFADLPSPVQQLGIELGVDALAFTAVNRALGEVGLKLPGIAETFGNLKTDIGLTTLEVEGLTTQLGLLEAIGPIAVTAVVSWELGSKGGDAIAGQMSGVAEAPFGNQNTASLEKELAVVNRAIAGKPAPDDDFEFTNLYDRYGIQQSGFFDYSAKDLQLLHDDLARDLRNARNTQQTAGNPYAIFMDQEDAADRQAFGGIAQNARDLINARTKPNPNGDGGNTLSKAMLADLREAADYNASTGVDDLKGSYDNVMRALKEGARTGDLDPDDQDAMVAVLKALADRIHTAEDKAAQTALREAPADHPRFAQAKYTRAINVDDPTEYKDRQDEITKIDEEATEKRQKLEDEASKKKSESDADLQREQQRVHDQQGDINDSYRNVGVDWLHQRTDYQLRMHEISTEQAAAEYEQILQALDEGTKEYDAVAERIQALRKQAQQEQLEQDAPRIERDQNQRAEMRGFSQDRPHAPLALHPIDNNPFKQDSDEDAQLQAHLEREQALFQQFADNTSNIFAHAFDGLLRGSHNVFQDVEHEFEHLIEQMIAQAAAADLSRALFGAKGSKAPGFEDIFGFGHSSGSSTTSGNTVDPGAIIAGGSLFGGLGSVVSTIAGGLNRSISLPTLPTSATRAESPTVIHFHGPVTTGPGGNAEQAARDIALLIRQKARTAPTGAPVSVL